MNVAKPYRLDTNVVLHATRQASPVSAAIDAQFQLRQSPFRPAISEVTVGELWAFAQSSKWRQARRERETSVKFSFLLLILNPGAQHSARQQGRVQTVR